MTSWKLLVSSATTFALLAGTAHATSWIVTVGGRGSDSPPYEGADHDVITPLPTISIRRADKPYRFVPPQEGVTLALISTRWISIGPEARLQEHRTHHEDLTGIHKVNTELEAGGFVDLWPTSWLRGHVGVRKGFTGQEGWVGDAGVDLIANGNRLSASIGPRVGVGDRQYMQAYFGVTDSDAASSPFIHTPFNASAGTRYWGGTMAATYKITGRWRTNADLTYHRLSGDAGNSPIIQIMDSRNQYSGSVGLSYSFGL